MVWSPHFAFRGLPKACACTPATDGEAPASSALLVDRHPELHVEDPEIRDTDGHVRRELANVGQLRPGRMVVGDEHRLKLSPVVPGHGSEGHASTVNRTVRALRRRLCAANGLRGQCYRSRRIARTALAKLNRPTPHHTHLES